MKTILANTVVLKYKAQGYHWNVKGMFFPQLHEFFGNLYEEIYSSIDKFAEEIRALNSYTPGSFKRFLELSKITDEERIISANEMLSQL